MQEFAFIESGYQFIEAVLHSLTCWLFKEGSFQASVVASVVAAPIWAVFAFGISIFLEKVYEVPFLSILSERLGRWFFFKNRLNLKGVWKNKHFQASIDSTEKEEFILALYTLIENKSHQQALLQLQKYVENIINTNDPLNEDDCSIDCMTVKQFGSYIIANTIRVEGIKSQHIYNMSAKNNKEYVIGSDIVGQWIEEETSSPGAFQLRIVNNNTLSGSWIKPDSNGRIETGRWEATRISSLHRNWIERLCSLFINLDWKALIPLYQQYRIEFKDKPRDNKIIRSMWLK